MKTSKFFVGFVSAFLLLLMVGCVSGLLSKNEGIFGKSSKTEAQIAAKIDNVDDKLAQLDQQRLTHIGAWSKGVERSLDAVTNQEPAVLTAQKINEQVEELANKPDGAELKQVYNIVDNLLTNLITGQKLLDKKDKEIISLQQQIENAAGDREAAVKEYRDVAVDTAKQRDQYATTIKQLDSGWGLNAVLYGGKKFITHIAWTLGIGAILFIILRIAAASNPIAGSIFSVFEVGASWGINSLKSIFPKSINFSSLVPKSISDGYKGTLKNIMDDVLLLENQQKSSPTTSKITLDELIVNLEKNLSTDDKARVNEIKTELNWKT